MVNPNAPCSNSFGGSKMRDKLLVTALLCSLLSFFTLTEGGLQTASQAASSLPPGIIQSNSVRFVAIGDAGTGGTDQKNVGRMVEQVCAARGCDFALYLGDNIYESGIRGDYDLQLESKFEIPYRNLKFPFYAALGNHDNSISGGEGAQNAVGDFEVEYTYRRDRMSDKWRMPARYFTIRRGDAQIFALDTNAVLTAGAGTSDPGSVKQLTWLQNELAASTARWKLTFGHHPYISNGQHGDAGMYDGAPGNGSNLKLFMEQSFCNKADVYLCGHDHDLQWLKPITSCGGTQFIVSGAGGKRRELADPARNAVNFQRGDTFGFFWIEINGDTLHAVVYDWNGTVLHEQSVTKTLP